MRKALIKDGVVVDVVDREFPVHPSLQWADCPDWVKYNDRYENGEFSEFVPDLDVMAKLVRSQRDHMLSKSDWTMIAPHLTTEQKAAWDTYRKALRDIPVQEGFPLKVIWPISPK